MQVPHQLLDSLKGIPGFDQEAFVDVHAREEQLTSIRLNPEKLAPADFPSDLELQQVPWCPHGFYLSHRPSFTLDPLFHAGGYYVQEASSMFLWELLRQVCPSNSQLVLDLCAAPGGKSTLLSSYFKNGLVISNEVIKSRASILQENITKWGDAQVVVTNNDARDFSNLSGVFDVIVADVPCSGSGLFRKDPSAVAEWSPGNVQLCSERQQRILADVIPALKQDGLLIYSTCSYSSEEDEDILDWLIGEFGFEPVTPVVPSEWNIVTTQSRIHGATGFRFFPDKIKGEGFFIAVLKKTADDNAQRQKESAIQPATAKENQSLSAFVEIPGDHIVFKHAENFRSFPEKYFSVLKVLAGRLYLKQAGVGLGEFKGKSFVPGHSLALSNIKTSFPEMEVGIEQALAYLRRQDQQLVGPQGWCKVTHRGLGLGWVKNLPNRTNNYYPSEWRILKA